MRMNVPFNCISSGRFHHTDRNKWMGFLKQAFLTYKDKRILKRVYSSN